MKKILFLTGTRADFGKLKPLMLRVDNDPELECHIFATGMHTLKRYGYTLKEIEKCGFKNIFQYMNQMVHTSIDMDLALAATINGLAHYVREYRPDLLVVHGDRVEALSGAIVGSLNNILVAHVEGGELSGTIDELIRHAVSKMAHVHFVANDEAASRLAQMGESKESIFVIGSPERDIMFSDDLPSLDEVKQRYNIEFKDYAIFSYHPVTTDIDTLPTKIINVVGALERSAENFIAIYPNNDSGADIIFEHLETLKGNPRFRFFPSIRFEYFLTLLKHSKMIVGNSSAGVREAPAYSVPTINIGNRQSNRFDSDSITHVEEDTAQILEAMDSLPSVGKPDYHYGKGNSADLFMKCLHGEKVWEISCQKQFQDLPE
ncbi:MAG: UDP-N-acetylglucosamine 2-epimerase [Gammaproteobacteria bacterium SG8_11]|nr:MAG: UDP-N-acetylglucosamine 2-epimerase [Gammaproteobacteria bacterium SG8_11]